VLTVVARTMKQSKEATRVFLTVSSIFLGMFGEAVSDELFSGFEKRNPLYVHLAGSQCVKRFSSGRDG